MNGKSREWEPSRTVVREGSPSLEAVTRVLPEDDFAHHTLAAQTKELLHLFGKDVAEVDEVAAFLLSYGNRWLVPLLRARGRRSRKEHTMNGIYGVINFCLHQAAPVLGDGDVHEFGPNRVYITIIRVAPGFGPSSIPYIGEEEPDP